MNTAIIVGLYSCSFLLIWQFVGYPIFMAILALKVKPLPKDYSFEPFVSILVPTFNEEKVIRKRIDNLFDLNYPKDKYEIIVVDSGSTDDTVVFTENIVCRNNNHFLKLIKEEERKGKASAINEGKKYAKGDIVLVTDANSIFDRDVLREMMPYFKNSKVGAVGGQYIVQNPVNNLTSSTQFYWDIEFIMRSGETVLDSACLFHGEINAWRKDLVNADPEMLSEDLDMAIQIRKSGYKIEYAPHALVYEPAPNTAEEQIKQRKRTSIGTIQSIIKHWKYFLLPRDWYSLMIFPSHKTLTMLSPLILLSILIFYLSVWDIRVISIHFLSTSLLFGILLFSLMKLKFSLQVNKETMKSSVSSIPSITYYVLLNEYIILLALKDFIIGNYSVLWEKAETTR